MTTSHVINIYVAYSTMFVSSIIYSKSRIYQAYYTQLMKFLLLKLVYYSMDIS